MQIQFLTCLGIIEVSNIAIINDCIEPDQHEKSNQAKTASCIFLMR